MAIFVPYPESIGRRRFFDNKSFRKQLTADANAILSQIQPLLASNYPKSASTNLNVFNGVISREIARINSSINSINNDKQYTQTRPQFLQQILGERLLLNKRIAPIGYDDQSYRNYLISIKNADLAGSKLSVLEALASEFSGFQVKIRELYLQARDPHSGLDVTSANKMAVQIFIDQLSGQDLNSIKDNLDFFINLTKPAHVLYNSDLIWLEQIDVNKVHDLLFGDTGGGCVPLYDFDYFNQPAYLALQVFILPNSQNSTGLIDSIHHADYVFYFDNSQEVITDPSPIDGTQIFDVTGKRVSFSTLQIGQYVRLNYQIIPGNFKFWRGPSVSQVADPFITDPLLTTPFSQFYKDIYRRPLFQESVKKLMDPKGRFPLQIKTTPTTVCDRWVQDALQPYYEDLRSNCRAGRSHPLTVDDTLGKHHGYPEFYWPWPESDILDPILLGNDFTQIMEHSPLTDGSGHPASPADVGITFNGSPAPGSIFSIDSSAGRVNLQDTTTYWETAFGRLPINGDLFNFTYTYLDGTNNVDASTSTVYGVSYWQLPKIPVVTNNGSLPDTLIVKVDGTQIPALSLDPLLGHVTLSPYTSFWLNSIGYTPRPGTVFEFDYLWGENFNYALFFDEPARILDGAADFPYGMLMDGTSETSAMPADENPAIGYRYRGYLLHHSSVLNSPDTLLLNDYQKPAKRASIANQQSALNHFNEVFSAEFLTDPNTPVLNDAYLANGLDPVVKLGPGTPPFQKTFSYQPGLIYQKKLQDIRTNHELLLYSDMLIKETQFGDPTVNLSPICDSDRLTFKTKLGEDDIDHIHECNPWILFDTVETESVTVSLPPDVQSVPNLRVVGQYLNENFILRHVEPTGTATFSFSFTTPIDSTAEVTYQLPSSFRLFYNDDWVSFPSLPIVNINSGAPVINSDIVCTVNGVNHPIVGLDASSGLVTIAPFDNLSVVEEEFTLTEEDALANEILLSGAIIDNQASFTIIHGTSQEIFEDFIVYGRHLTWYFSSLHNQLQAGDKIRVSYTVNPFIGATIQFTYHIINNALIDMIDRDHSRIMDNGYVFGGLCPDIENVELGLTLPEYYGMLDDYSDGIKLSFFNKDTLQVEDHIFSGPVFETYDAAEDEIAVPDNFSNALVRITNPLSVKNPLNFSADYGFLNDQLARFRKKTYQELMPDQTFRTLKLVEMLPV